MADQIGFQIITAVKRAIIAWGNTLNAVTITARFGNGFVLSEHLAYGKSVTSSATDCSLTVRTP